MPATAERLAGSASISGSSVRLGRGDLVIERQRVLGDQVTHGLECLSRCVTVACCRQDAGSALLQIRYGAGLGLESVMAQCLQIWVFWAPRGCWGGLRS